VELLVNHIMIVNLLCFIRIRFMKRLSYLYFGMEMTYQLKLYRAFDWKPISRKKRITKVDSSTILTMGK